MGYIKQSLNLIENKLNKHFTFTILVVLAIVVICYLIMVNLLPYFKTDDFYIFYLIERNPSSLFVCIPREKFFLFYRPITYLYLWVLYTVLGYNSFIMKIVALNMLVASLLLFIGIVRNAGKYYRVKISTVAIIICVLFISFHPDTIMSVLWISNANELLMVFFYLLTYYLISLMLLERIKPSLIFILFSSLTFLLSVLSKQQALHLPLLVFLFFVFNKKQINTKQKKALLVLLYIISTIMFFILVINLSPYLDRNTSENLLIFLWKKPFTLLGLLLYIIFPLYGLEIYSFFMLHKLLAIFLTLVGICFFYFYSKIYYANIKAMLIYALITMIIFFPRLIVAGGDRINVVQLFSLSLIIPIIFTNLQELFKKIVIILFICGIFGGWYGFWNFHDEFAYSRKMDHDFIKFAETQDCDKFVLAYNNRLSTTPNSFYYSLNRKFGITSSPLNSGIIIRDFPKGFPIPTNIYVTVLGDTINIQTSSPTISIDIDKTEILPIILKSTNSFRGYSSISFKLNPSLTNKPYELIMYTDSGWVRLK